MALLLAGFVTTLDPLKLQHSTYQYLIPLSHFQAMVTCRGPWQQWSVTAALPPHDVKHLSPFLCRHRHMQLLP